MKNVSGTSPSLLFFPRLWQEKCSYAPNFSVHDTVIISDRIREHMRRGRRENVAKTLNTSINETLSRTIINSGTALLVTLALFFLGGNVIHGFAFALLVGFTVGTYSSIYIATPVVLMLAPSKARGR